MRDKKITIKVIEQIDLWDSFYEDWQRLLALSRPQHPFLLWVWVRFWAQRMLEEKKTPILLVLSVADGEVVGLVPLQAVKHGPFRIIEGFAQEFCDYIDWLYAPELENEIGQAIYDWLAMTTKRFDYIRVYNIFPDGFAYRVLNRASPDALIRHSIAPQIKISGKFEDYLKTLNPKFYSDIKRRERKLIKEKGPIEYVLVTENNELVNVMDVIAKWLSSRLEKKGASSYLEREGMVKHLVGLYQALNTADILHLSAFKVNNEYAAINVAFKYDNKLFSYTPVFDPQLSAYSIIRLLKFRHIEECFQEDRDLYDLCLGGEKYKLDFQSEIKQLYSFTKYSSRYKGLAKRCYDQVLKPMAKKHNLLRTIISKCFK